MSIWVIFMEHCCGWNIILTNLVLVMNLDWPSWLCIKGMRLWNFGVFNATYQDYMHAGIYSFINNVHWMTSINILQIFACVCFICRCIHIINNRYKPFECLVVNSILTFLFEKIVTFMSPISIHGWYRIGSRLESIVI